VSAEPWYIWALVLTGAVGLPALTAGVLDRAARQVGMSRSPGAVLAVAAGIWLASSVVLADSGSFHRAGHTAPWFAIAVLGVLAIAIGSSLVPTARRLLATRDASAWLTVPHTVRVVGVVFLILAAQGRLPWLFALPAGLGDMAIGSAAPRVARRLARDPNAPGATKFHLLGIADLIVALTLGFLCGLGPIHLIAVPSSTLPLSQLPLALIPTVAVPLAIALHVAALTHRGSPAPRTRRVREAPSVDLA